ncbi:probable serine/threonine-protein kinase DDB_G0291918 isoform X2 [Octopus sinensis]|nr:probable serine/threonine-protein kinase DDB_G0291918 isoform X2 [Octopus sinensis]
MMLATLGMLYSRETPVSHSMKNSSKKQKTMSSKADILKSQVDWNYSHRATEMMGDWPAMTLTQNTPLQYRYNIRPDVSVSLNSTQLSSSFSDTHQIFSTSNNKINNNNTVNNDINNDNSNNKNDADDPPYSKLCASPCPYPISASKFVSIHCPSSVVAVPSHPPPLPPPPRPMLAPLLQPVTMHPLLLPLPLRVALPHPPLPLPSSLPLTFY